MVCLGNEPRSFCNFWCCTQILTVFWTLVYYKDYSISFKGFLPTVVNAHLNYVHPFWSILIHWFLRCRCSLLPSPAWPHPIYLDSWTNISGSYEIWFFIALDFTFTTRHIHNWVSFLLWPSCFILSEAISNCLLLSPRSILDTLHLRDSSSDVISFRLFILFMWFSQQEYWSGLPFPPPVDNILSELFTMTRPS